MVNKAEIDVFLELSCFSMIQHLRSGVVAEKSNLMSKERRLCGRKRAERSYSTLKVRGGGVKEIPLVQGKEQWLCFAGAALKRYPMSKVRETQLRW